MAARCGGRLKGSKRRAERRRLRPPLSSARLARPYPRWTKDESAVVYHCNVTGKNQLYMYRLSDGSTVRVSTNADANYMFACGKRTPK